ncbi:MAG TPA: nicotinate (nicotinamide) nucleotide adenylyltransferase [Planctomycetota bacterium]|nr:nicotinate (nicotinamide) nucleotide adenylyltransferase [Planctomycetota bacterium]
MEPEARKAKPLGPYKRFGVMGGSFDPVHVGHLSIAQQIFNGLKLEQVVLLPAATPPHKQEGRAMTPAAERLHMCELAVHNMHGLSVSDFEIKRGGVSYTVETARQIRQAYGPEAQIYFVIGSDSLADLPQWYEIKELVTLIDFAIAERRETPIKESLWLNLRTALGAEAEAKLRKGVVEVQRVDVSSTLIRQLLAAGEKVPGYLRRDVEEYIRAKGLYGAPPKPTATPRIIMP